MEGERMGEAGYAMSPSAEAYYAVSVALSGLKRGDVISTKSFLQALGADEPSFGIAQEDVLKLLVYFVTGRTMAVNFDHREPA
jgi:hypothetical protein